jgi:hypothetical protein
VTSALTRARFEGPKASTEYWLARRLGLPLNWDAGDTTTRDRREVIGRAIVERGLAYSIAVEHPTTLERETFAELYLRLYGEPLPEPTPERHENGDGV